MILNGEKERQGDFVFTANFPGDYEFCFSNEMSTFADKFVDFEISVGSTTFTRFTNPCELACTTMLTTLASRSKMKLGLSCRQSKERAPSIPLSWKSLFIRSRVNFRPSLETRNISAHVRTETLVPFAAPSRGL